MQERAARPRRRSSRSARRGRRCRRSRCRAPLRGPGPRPRAAGSFSSTRAERGSSRTVSPLRSFTSRRASTSSHDALLVGPADDQGAVAVEALLEDDDLAGELGAAGQHDVERLVEDDLGPAAERLVAQLGVHGHADLAAAGEHVDGAVVVVPDDRAVGRRRLGELVDLLAQRGDVVARLAEGVGELLVLGDRLGQLALGLEQPLLEGADALGRVLEAPPEGQHLLLEGPRVLLQLGQLGLVA